MQICNLLRLHIFSVGAVSAFKRQRFLQHALAETAVVGANSPNVQWTRVSVGKYRKQLLYKEWQQSVVSRPQLVDIACYLLQGCWQQMSKLQTNLNSIWLQVGLGWQTH